MTAPRLTSRSRASGNGEIRETGPFASLYDLCRRVDKRRVNRRAPSGESETPLQKLGGILTPADLHFERHHAGVPAIDPARYRLLVHGMVERPMVFSLADLKRYPSRSQICFIECSGNGYRGYLRNLIKPEWTPQQIDGLTSTSEWTGVPLATLMREVGVRPGATWLLAESTDAAKMTRSIPVEKARDDAMIAYGQNGEQDDGSELERIHILRVDQHAEFLRVAHVGRGSRQRVLRDMPVVGLEHRTVVGGQRITEADSRCHEIPCVHVVYGREDDGGWRELSGGVLLLGQKIAIVIEAHTHIQGQPVVQPPGVVGIQRVRHQRRVNRAGIEQIDFGGRAVARVGDGKIAV